MTHGVLSHVLFYSWMVVLILFLTRAQKLSLTFQWVGAVSLTVLGIWRAAWDHEHPVMIAIYVAVAAIGFPYVAVQQYRKGRRPQA